MPATRSTSFPASSSDLLGSSRWVLPQVTEPRRDSADTQGVRRARCPRDHAPRARSQATTATLAGGLRAAGTDVTVVAAGPSDPDPLAPAVNRPGATGAARHERQWDKSMNSE